MPKAQKSSATSGTRKKHARKAAGSEQQLPLPKEKKPKDKTKGKNKEPRPKVYIPPTKPSAVKPDPLDSQGIAKKLPPELVIVLRRLGKKDAVTKRKALEDLQADWVLKASAAESDYALKSALQLSLPVWLHHLPPLLLHYSRRIRLQAAELLTAYLRIPELAQRFVSFLRGGGSPSEIEQVVGSWSMATQDVDRQVSLTARKGWDVLFLPWTASPAPQEWGDDTQALDSNTVQPLFEFVKRAVYDPQGVFLELNPIQPTYVPPVHGGHGKGHRSQPQPQEEDSSARLKPEDDEESEDDRNARIRTGALGVIRWFLDTASNSDLDIVPSTSLFWTSLYHGASPPFCDESAAFGSDQPAVRKTAWSIVSSLVKSHKKFVSSHLPVLSTAILRSAWVEPQISVRSVMWEPLLSFLTQFPSAWNESDKSDQTDKDEEEGDSDSDDEDGAEETSHPLPGDESAKGRPGSIEAFRDFLQFLQLGCYGSPTQGYPVIVVVLSTLPATILGNDSESWSDLFTSFWAALDGRAFSSLDRLQTSAAFLNSLLECLVFLVKRRANSQKQAGEPVSYEDVHLFVQEQMSRVWTELSTRKLRVDENEAGKTLARTFSSLEVIDNGLSQAAWQPIADSLALSFQNESSSKEDIDHQLGLLWGLERNAKDDAIYKDNLSELIHELTKAVLNRCWETSPSPTTSVPGDDALSRLTSIITVFGDIVFDPSTINVLQQLDELILSDVTSRSPALWIAYLQKRGNEESCARLWRKCLLTVASSDGIYGRELLTSLLDASERGVLPVYLKPSDNELDQYAAQLVAEAVSSNASETLTLVGRLLSKPGRFLSASAVAGLVHSIAFAFVDKYRALLRETTSGEFSGSLQAPLQLLSGCIDAQPDIVSSNEIRVFLPDIFSFAFLSDVSGDAKKIWGAAMSTMLGEEKEDLIEAIKRMLRELIADTDVSIPPSSVLAVASNLSTGISFDVLHDLFPSQVALERMLEDLPSDPSDYALAIVDRLIPPLSFWKTEQDSLQSFDEAGLSEYARTINTLLTVAISDRKLARDNMWMLPHFIYLYLVAKDTLTAPSDNLVLFEKHVPQTQLKDIVARVETLSAFLLSDVAEDTWHSTIVQSLVKNDNTRTVDSLGRFIFELMSNAPQKDAVRDSRILHFVVQHLLNGATTSDADQWLLFARQIEKKAPHSAVGMILAITQSGLEPPRLDRYRNELAAGILSISPAKADTDGLLLLHRLAATAPSLESDIIFLPQNRAVNFMKTCQQWVTSDDDINEDVECEMLVVFQYLVPILQNMPGSHWDLIFDMIENNLETSSFSDHAMLTLLTRTLRLLQDIRILTQSNKSLKAIWVEREDAILKLVRDLVQNAQVVSHNSVPRTICWDLALTIVQELPLSLINESTLSKMVHVLGDPDVSILRMVYPLLTTAANMRTEHVVIEAGVDASEDAKFELPPELLELVQTIFEISSIGSGGTKLLGYLLAWMTIFNLFDNASLRVKMSYAGQLRDLNIISTSFLPAVFELLGLYGGKKKPVQLDIWEVQEYYVQLYDEDSEISNVLLAAHLYYRALLNIPSLVAAWWGECKDRQLSMAVANMTARHFSPVLISAELKHVKDPAAEADLSGENWTFKVSNAIHEVSAEFTVDEESMEIAIRLPADYPLHSVEVKDIRRLGVEEKRWRGWLLAVQQVVTSQNGRIVDGLGIFKRNVTNHFENQTECAICYSIVSATELSLPKKRCRTCKNRFHAGCLYKWFNTSHTSSCPLCRSDFI